MSRASQIFLLGCTLLLLVAACQEQSTPPLNVVVLFTDDQRFNTIQALGNPAVHTPNMDRLVNSGISFTQAHIMGSHHGGVCAPSRAMLLSGKPYMNIPQDYIDQGQASYEAHFPFLTFPELLRAEGYQTFFTGKWHNNTSKIREGFTDGANIFIGGMHWPKDGGHRRPRLWDFDPSARFAAENQWQGEAFSSEMYSDAAVNFIQQQNGQTPFCLYVAYTSPHDPREAPDQFRQRYDTAKLALPPNFLPQHPFDNGHLRTRDENLVGFPRTAAIVKEELAAYYAMISEVDAQIGRVLDALDAQGLTEKTIIVFAGDNGLAVGQHGLLGKQSVYDHSVRVPLIMAAPGLRGNRRASTLCYLYDVFPTLCDLLHLDIPETVEGRSLLPALLQEEAVVREQLFLAHAKEMRAIREASGWKLIHNFVKGQSYTQLFDLNTDPWEQRNLAEVPAHAERKTRLYQQLGQAIEAFGDDFLKPHIRLQQDQLGAPVTAQLIGALPGVEIRYQLEGGAAMKTYEAPLTITQSTALRAQLFQNDQAIGQPMSAEVRVAENIAALELQAAPAAQYAGRGKRTLVDGANGSVDFRDGNWIGLEGVDAELDIRLKEPQAIHQLGIRYLSHPGSWIFPPQGFTVEVSMDGEKYERVLSETLPQLQASSSAEVKTHQVELEGVEANYIRYKVINQGRCPDWHAGKGGKAWLFLDEVFFN